MNIQRLATNQILAAIPLESAREVTWRALARANLQDVVIDREKNVVAASNGANWRSNGETVTARFSEEASGTRIEMAAHAHFSGKLDFGRAKRRGKKLTDVLEAEFSRPPDSPGAGAMSAVPGLGGALPIAAPTGESSYVMGAPVYGVAMPAKRGAFIMTYAVLGLVLIHILSPISWYYAQKTLKDYGELDPGDKKLVKWGRAVGIMGTVVLVGLWGLQGFLIARGPS